MLYMGTFKPKHEKSIEISTLELVKIQSFMKNNKTLSLGKYCLSWVFLGCNFKKLLINLKLAPSNLSKLNFQPIQRMSAQDPNFQKVRGSSFRKVRVRVPIPFTEHAVLLYT